MTTFFRFANVALASAGGHVVAVNFGIPLAVIIGSLAGAFVAIVAQSIPAEE